MVDNWQRDSTTRASSVRQQYNVQSNWKSPDNMTDKQVLKEQFYLKQFLFHLQSSSNLPTLSNPQLLMNIQRENQRLQKDLDVIRSGKRQQMLSKKLSSLGKQAQSLMVKMKQFKSVREYERNLIKQLMSKKSSNQS